jgi:hypothetical protein
VLKIGELVTPTHQDLYSRRTTQQGGELVTVAGKELECRGTTFERP